MLDAILPYIIAPIVIVLIILRIIRGKKSGATAVRYEVLYLVIYGFLGGVLVSFFLNHPEFGWMSLAIFGTFLAGFIMRAYPLFRLISSVEKITGDSPRPELHTPSD